MKEEFILSEIWYLTISGAFQRANVYKEGITEKEKEDFKRNLRECITEIAEDYENEVVIEDTVHLTNIYKIMKISHNCLNNGSLNFGISQKLLNLYLKYLWCLGKIPAPPHFPVDRTIQEKLGMKVEPWTRMNDESDYMKVIQKARDFLNINKEHKNIAKLELALFRKEK